MTEFEQRLKGITINSYDEENPPAQWQILDTAILYASVFAGYPWYEVNKCPSCESYFGATSTVGSSCEKCGNAVIGPAYPLDKMVAQVSEALEKPGANMFLAEANGELTGFAWTHFRETEEYLTKFKTMSPEVETKITPLLSRKQKLYSLAEIGVAQNMRGRGLGKRLFDLQTKSGDKHGLTQVVWTRYDTNIPSFCLNQGFIQIFGPEVILEYNKTKLTGRDLIGKSPTSSERVLFVK